MDITIIGVIALTSIVWIVIGRLIGGNSKVKGYKKGYYNGWTDHSNEKLFNDDYKK